MNENGQRDPLLREAESLRRKSEKPPKTPRWLPTNPAHLQCDIEDEVLTQVKVLAVLNKRSIHQVVNDLLDSALRARKGGANG